MENSSGNAKLERSGSEPSEKAPSEPAVPLNEQEIHRKRLVIDFILL